LRKKGLHFAFNYSTFQVFLPDNGGRLPKHVVRIIVRVSCESRTNLNKTKTFREYQY